LQTFVANPNRDASHVIAGFVYQVDVTLLHWLKIAPNTSLELECGEDIDLIEEGVEGGDLWTLEQVKKRTSPLTLQSPDAIKAISNFCEHKAQNPQIRLRFRYITTSGIGKERNWHLSGTAIEAWQAIQQGSLTEDARVDFTNGIRSFLLASPKPADLSASTWQSLQFALHDELGFANVVETFEWSTGSTDDAVTESDIKIALTESGHASDLITAQALYERLFVYVFKTLTRQGRKLLTRNALAEQLSQPPLSREDRQLFSFMTGLRSLNEKVDSLEQQFLQDHGLVINLGAQIAHLKDAALTIDYRDPSVNFDSPTLVQPYTPRTDAVRDISTILESGIWIHIIGEPGLGKTQLGLLATQHLGSPTFWINLRDCTESQACEIVDASIGSASGTSRRLLIREWYEAAALRLKNSTIVIDDLPRIPNGGRLAQRLEFLCTACQIHGVRLLTIGYHSLPSSLSDAHEFKAPSLTNSEIGTLLAVHGAPTSYVNEIFSEFLATLTQRLPVLVTAVAKFLANRKWNVESSNLQALLEGEFAKGIREDAKRFIAVTVPDPESRELLYRLRLIVGSFTKAEVEVIGRVPKKLTLSLEKLEQLKGLWVHESEGGKYQLSALLDNSLSGYLEVKTKRGVHATLALLVTAKKKLDPVDVLRAFFHFVEAGLLRQAVVLLIQALLSADQKGVIDHWGVSEIWSRDMLPTEIDINLRLFLRALQIGAFYKKGRDTSFLVEDFDRLIQMPATLGEAQWGRFMSASFLVIRFAFTKPSWANKYLLLALRDGSGDSILLPNGKKLKVPNKARIEMTFWVTANRSASYEDVEDWLATITRLTPDQRLALKKSELAKDNVAILCDSIWLREYRKPESEREWDKAEHLLRDVERTAVDLDFSLLRGAAIRTQIVILAENLGKLTEAVSRAEAAVAGAGSDNERFLVLEVTGRQLAYGGRWDEAIKWLKKALALGVKGFPIWERNDLLTLSEGISQSNVNEATQYTEEAVRLSKAEILEPLRTAEALGEHSIALWFAGNRSASFNALEEAVGILMQARQNTMWTQAFLLFLQLAGYFGANSLNGLNSNEIESPRRGMFLASDSVSVDLYKPIHESLLFIRLAMFAEEVGNSSAAGAWTRRALDQSPDEAGVSAVLRWFSWMLVAPALLSGDWQTPIEIADLTIHIPSVRPDDLGVLGITSGDDKLKISEAMANDALKERGFYSALVPLVLRLATLRFDRSIVEEISGVKSMLMARSSTNNDIWQEFAEAMANLFEPPDPDWKRFYEMLDKQNRVGIRLVAYLGSILYSPVPQSLAFQVGFAQELEYLTIKKSSIFSEIVEPFFIEYWTKAAESGDLGFRTRPSYAAGRVVEISSLPPGKRLRRLLREMVFCTGLQVRETSRKWLEEES
jgi:tetratricopeptide (TPR) repeat protein